VARPRAQHRRGAAGARHRAAELRPRQLRPDLCAARTDAAAWEAELARALGFGTEHLSLYQLTIEPGTRFRTRLQAKGELTTLDPDEAAVAVRGDPRDDGRRGCPPMRSRTMPVRQESRHNLTYWRYGDYAGIGPGAHGRRGGFATVRHKKPENWIAAGRRQWPWPAERGRDLPADARAGGPADGAAADAEGIDLDHVAARSGVPVDELIDDAAVDRLATHGLVALEGRRLRVTEAGMLLLNAILAEIVAV
jgi:coproporphyrinogen III oxidase-like Fe-S oxidoreductase